MFKNRKVQIVIAILSILLLVGIDQLTKYYANTYLELGKEGPILIKYILSLRLAYNTGAGFSILTGKKFFLVSISAVASVVEIVLLCKLVDFKKALVLSLSLILVTAGTMGNLIDRAFFEKGVIDFLNFEFMEFPIFNFADSCLTIGACLLIVYMLFIADDAIFKTSFAKGNSKEQNKEKDCEEGELNNGRSDSK